MIAFQLLVDTAFDPAAAFVVTVVQADAENAIAHTSVIAFLEKIWSTIDPLCRAVWADTWNQFRETRALGLSSLVGAIGAALKGFSARKVTGQSEILLTLSEAAGVAKSVSPPTPGSRSTAHDLRSQRPRRTTPRHSTRLNQRKF